MYMMSLQPAGPHATVSGGGKFLMRNGDVNELLFNLGNVIRKSSHKDLLKMLFLFLAISFCGIGFS